MNALTRPRSVISRARLAAVGVTAALLLIALPSAALAAEPAGGKAAFRFVLSGTADVPAAFGLGVVVAAWNAGRPSPAPMHRSVTPVGAHA